MSLWPRQRVRIRRLRAEDATQWRDLRLEALANHPEAFGSTHDDWASRPLSDFADRLEHACILGAIKAESLVGCMALDSARGRGEITAVYVRQDWRGRGVARALLKAQKRLAQQQGVSKLYLTVADSNRPAIRFYERAGFLRSEGPSRALARDGQLLDLITMTMEL
ncbi:GNAT family N-acetyltransferase [Nioella sp.]|uniref:GNAT family N-acetyltransferase n=1 Tax=Nioella sp. TaxID=1912091 RepID=UPI003B53007F